MRRVTTLLMFLLGLIKTAAMHIGNYLSEDYNRRILKIVDLHSISTGFVPSKKITLYGEFAGISTDQVVEDWIEYTLV
uniref:Uncharacterized protein n=1 Tax=Meloidogyne incognita TaxID=6306 RepID=A0A914L5B0_MELIC